MSDPNDPYRYEDVGEGLNPFGETISDLEGVKAALGEITEKFKEMSSSMDIFKNLEPVVKKIKDSKFTRGVNKLGGMFKSMAGAVGSINPIQKLMGVLKPLIDLFKPFQVVLDIISSLIKVLVANALGPMFEALQPLFDALMELMPVFARIGTKVGELIARILQPLVRIFVALMPVIEPILDIFIMLIELALIPLEVILGIIAPILESLAPLFGVLGDVMEPLQPIFELLGGVIGWLVVVAMIPLIGAVYGVGIAIAALMDFFTLGAAGAVKSWNDLMLPILDSLVDAAAAGPQFPIDDDEGGEEEDEGETPTDDRYYDPHGNVIDYELPEETPPPSPPEEEERVSDYGRLTGLAEGGIAMSQGIYELAEGGEPEVVVPLSKWEKTQSEQIALLGLMHDELVQTNFINRKLVKINEWNQAFRG